MFDIRPRLLSIFPDVSLGDGNWRYSTMLITTSAHEIHLLHRYLQYSFLAEALFPKLKQIDRFAQLDYLN
jgi:hypothetical protein